jgi:hypothetical protein
MVYGSFGGAYIAYPEGEDDLALGGLYTYLLSVHLLPSAF